MIPESPWRQDRRHERQRFAGATDDVIDKYPVERAAPVTNPVDDHQYEAD